MNPTASYIALAVFVIGMLVTIFFAISTDYEANAEKERTDQKGGKHGSMKKAILRILAILAAAVLVFIADSFIDGETLTAVFRRIERVWNSITNNRLNSYWLYWIGPYAFTSGVAIILCIISGIVYKKKGHGISFVFTIVFGIISVIAAIISNKRWSSGRVGTYAGYALLAGSIIITLFMLILCSKASKKKDAERQQQREAERQQRAQQAEERRAARDEKIEQVRNAVSAGTEKIVSQAKESAASLASATKQILADGNNPVGGTTSGDLPVSAFAPSDPETFIPQIGGDEYALEKIKALHDLLKSGFVTQEEFEQKKQELLGKV